VNRPEPPGPSGGLPNHSIHLTTAPDLCSQLGLVVASGATVICIFPAIR
jgi:hypothetical protein